MIDAVGTFYRARFTRGSFGHNVLVMFTGTAAGQMGAILLAPVLTRMYSPAMFGVLGLFTAALTILSVVASLRYEMALPLTQSPEDAANLLAVCLASLLATTIIGCAAIAVLSFFHPSALLGRLAPYRWLLPGGFFLIGAYQVMVYFATREGTFQTIARTKVYQGLVGPLSQIGLGLCGLGAGGLIVGYIAGQSTGVSLLFSRLVVVPRTLGGVSLSGMRRMAARFKRFPLVSSWSALVEAAGGSYLLLVAVPLLYSNRIAGFVFLADRIIGRPLLMVSTSILQVYIGDMSRRINGDPETARRRFLQLAGCQFMIVLGWLAIINLAAPTVFPLLFGREWQEAVPYLRVLSIAYLPQMVIHALVHTLQVLERQVMSALWEGGRFLAVAGALAVAYAHRWDALHALLAYSIVQALAQIVLFMLMYRSIVSLRKENAYA